MIEVHSNNNLSKSTTPHSTLQTLLANLTSHLLWPNFLKYFQILIFPNLWTSSSFSSLQISNRSLESVYCFSPSTSQSLSCLGHNAHHISYPVLPSITTSSVQSSVVDTCPQIQIKYRSLIKRIRTVQQSLHASQYVQPREEFNVNSKAEYSA